MPLPFVDRSSSSLPVQFVAQPKWRSVAARSRAPRGAAGSNRSGMAGKAGDLAVLPGRDGKAAGAVLVLSAKPTLWDFGALATRLPAGTWRLASDTAPVSPTDAAVAIGLGTWRFERYRSKKAKAGRQDHLAAGRRQGARHGDHRVDLHGARSHHHAVVRHGPGRARRGGAGARQDAQGQGPRDRGRRSPEAELSRWCMPSAAPAAARRG